jgi:hypothetical protein
VGVPAGDTPKSNQKNINGDKRKISNQKVALIHQRFFSEVVIPK